MQAKIGAEVEYFLVEQGRRRDAEAADSKDDSLRPCYDARGVTRMYDHLTSISDAMNALGWGNYANDHEDAAGQFEQNFNYAEALDHRGPRGHAPLHPRASWPSSAA